MSVKEAQERIDSREFAEWMAMESLSGTTGPKRLDILLAHQTAILTNMMSSLWAKRHKRIRPEDCQVKWASLTPRRADPMTIKQKMMAWALAVNKSQEEKKCIR